MQIPSLQDVGMIQAFSTQGMLIFLEQAHSTIGDLELSIPWSQVFLRRLSGPL